MGKLCVIVISLFLMVVAWSACGDDSINNVSIEELNNPENSGFYVNRWSWGFGITSESFPNIPYKLNLDYSVSDLGILGISSQIGLTFKL